MYTMYMMKVFSITEGRKQLGHLVNRVVYKKEIIALGKRGRPDVLLIPYADEGVVPIASMAVNGGSFDWLNDEPDLYSVSDLQKRHA